MKHANEIRRFVANGDYKVTDGGVLIHGGIMARGLYTHDVNGEDEQSDPNLIPAEGILHILDVAFGVTAKEAAWYLALYSGNATPAVGWTAANFTGNSTENVSTTEGFSGTVRPAWTPTAATAGKIGNLSARAAFTIVSASSVTFYGAGLLSSANRGSTSGVLASATRFAASRTLNNTDVFNLGYEVELTDS